MYLANMTAPSGSAKTRGTNPAALTPLQARSILGRPHHYRHLLPSVPQAHALLHPVILLNQGQIQPKGKRRLIRPQGPSCLPGKRGQFIWYFTKSKATSCLWLKLYHRDLLLQSEALSYLACLDSVPGNPLSLQIRAKITAMRVGAEDPGYL